MRKLILFAFILIACACKKDSMPSDRKILSVTANGKIHQTFEYDGEGRLVRENEYSSCTTTPMNEFKYTYKGAQLEKMNIVLRSLYSSTAALCDPSSGMHSEHIFSYDNSGRINKVTVSNITTDYQYNSKGFISKRLLGGGSNKFIEYFYDSRGNVIKYIDTEGNVTEYEYDSAPNPFYRHRPIGTPFTMSPNNIIRGKGASNFVRKFEYKSSRPVKVLDDNGQTYEYHYE